MCLKALVIVAERTFACSPSVVDLTGPPPLGEEWRVTFPLICHGSDRLRNRRAGPPLLRSRSGFHNANYDRVSYRAFEKTRAPVNVAFRELSNYVAPARSFPKAACAKFRRRIPESSFLDTLEEYDSCAPHAYPHPFPSSGGFNSCLKCIVTLSLHCVLF